MPNEINVDLALVKQVAADAGSMYEHDIDAVAALYPDFVKQTLEAASARLGGRKVPPEQLDTAKRHLAALALADIWRKRGLVDPARQALIAEARDAATAFLAPPKPPAKAAPGATGPTGTAAPAPDTPAVVPTPIDPTAPTPPAPPPTIPEVAPR